MRRVVACAIGDTVFWLVATLAQSQSHMTVLFDIFSGPDFCQNSESMAPSQEHSWTLPHLTCISHTGWSYSTWPVMPVFGKWHALPPLSPIHAKVKLKPFKFYTFWHTYSNIITNENPLLNAIFVEVNFICKYHHFLNHSVTTHFQTSTWTDSESWQKSSPENISNSTVMWLWLWAKVATNQNMVTPMARATTLLTGWCQSEIEGIYY